LAAKAWEAEQAAAPVPQLSGHKKALPEADMRLMIFSKFSLK
jgi:hypothetical protein